MTITRLHKACLLAGLSTLAMAAQPAVAQDGTTDQTANDPASGGEIIVTAQRREQRLQDTPIAITALTTEGIADRQITNVEALATNTPGLFLSQVSASPNALQIGLRGALEQNGGTVTSESPVAVYIDDVYQSRLSAANYDLADIARVEVLRGPQGTLYGRNSMTGAIKLVTRQPDGKSWMNADVSYGRFEEVRSKVNFGTPIGQNLAIAGSAFYAVRNKGWQYNDILQKDVSKFRKYGAQLAVAIIDVPNLEAVLTGRYTASLTDGLHFVPTDYATNTSAASGFYNTRSPVDGDGDLKQKSVSLRLGYTAGNVTFRSITAYQSLTDIWAIDFSGGLDIPDVGVVAGFFRHSDGKQHQFTQEFQILGKALDDRLNWIVGAFYFNELGQQVFGQDNLAAFFLPQILPTTIRNRSKSKAVYAQADYKITDKLTASAGIRYSVDNKYFTGASQNGFEEAVPTLIGVSTETSSKVWTPRFNLQYDFTDRFMAYATIAKGYRAGGFNSLVVADPANYGSPYKPEFAWSYEAGFKLSALDRRATLNSAIYWQELSDLQTLATGQNASFITQNAAKSEIWGVETEASIKPVDGLELFGNLTYTHDKYTEVDPTSQAAISGATRLPLISRWQYQVGGTFEIPVSDNDAIKFAADMSARSRYQLAIVPSRFAESKITPRINAAVTYKIDDERLSLYVEVKNLNNSKDYYTQLEFIPGVIAYKAPLEPRTWRVGARMNF